MALSPEVAAVPRRIFSPIADAYDQTALVLSLFQYRRWHRFLLSRMLPPSTDGAARGKGPAFRVLDVATGTGALALELLRYPGVQVVGLDITRPMLRTAQRRASKAQVDLGLIEGTAEAPPLREAAFDSVVFAYLLRYVSDVPGTLGALGRLVKPGGVMAALDFAVPRGVFYPPWLLYTGLVLPAAGRAFSAGWARAGAFLGPSIRDFYRRWPEPRLLDAWREAGFSDVESRRLSVGGGIVTWGTKAA